MQPNHGFLLMLNGHTSKHTTFYAIGLSYQKADAEIRGHFSLDEEQKHALIAVIAIATHHGVIISIDEGRQ